MKMKGAAKLEEVTGMYLSHRYSYLQSILRYANACNVLGPLGTVLYVHCTVST